MKNYLKDWADETWAFLLLRIWLAVRALFTALEKFEITKVRELEPEELVEMGIQSADGKIAQKTYEFSLAAYHGIPQGLVKPFLDEPLMTKGMLDLYSYALGAGLAVLGMTLLLGIATRASLVLMGLLYTSLTFGMILINQDAGIAWLAIHMIMIVMALRLAKYNRLTVMKSW